METDAPNAVNFLAPALNEAFSSTSRNLTGSLGQVPEDQFDLVMTNPPYVTRGTGKQREFLREHSGYYGVSGSGIENLFLQMIIKGLKPGARGLIVVPDGILLRHSEDLLRAHILSTCNIEAVVSLPINTFYSTPKKTYILVIRKKHRAGGAQTSPVFSYLVGNVGETLDAKRFVIGENDLPGMASQFRLFQGNPEAFSSIDPRCKVFPISKFKASDHWLVNKWWSLEERERLGDIEAEVFVGAGELSAALQGAALTLSGYSKDLSNLTQSVEIDRTTTLSLSDSRYFRMGIGERVLKKDMFGKQKGNVPLYSANVEVGKEHGFIEASNLRDFSRPSLLWSIDSDFNMTVRSAGEVFATTDHCGRLEILDGSLDPAYCQAAIVYGYGRTFGFDRVVRPSLGRMKKVTLRVPVKADGSFDLQAQQELAKAFTEIREAVKGVEESLTSIIDLKPRVDIPKDAVDVEIESLRPTSQGRKGAASRADEEDARIAVKRLKEIHDAPSKLVRGRQLSKRLSLLEKT
jgi:hypothetical protein